MKYLLFTLMAVNLLFCMQCSKSETSYLNETKAQKDTRMEWWREARFGMFIHWGLYAIPAGEWNGTTNHAEWIRTTAQIPLKEYDKFAQQFNPVKFNAERWVKAAKNAGMKYIVITSKHHDGFCLFDSDYTDFDVMSTPFKRDILKELAVACRKEGIKMCWYHSIMDWHHPDYLPRRNWETDRSAEGAQFDRYVTHLKNQLKELVTNYGHIGVLWFDGEWESTWNHEYGKDLYNYVRSLQPDIIINNRVDKGRAGMQGLTKEGEFVGDFGTPEQEIPPTGLPGVDWETCMTMNKHWGYNKYDNNWKSAEDLIRKLADIASKGGNFLLNIGPTAEGEFPTESIERLQQIGKWMDVNGESIYGTGASPFKELSWGRCTSKPLSGNTRLYLHVYDWPENSILTVPGILNEPLNAYLLSDPGKASLTVTRKDDALCITLPENAPDPVNSVVVLNIKNTPNVFDMPAIDTEYSMFIDTKTVKLVSESGDLEIRFTTDGSVPNAGSEPYTEPFSINRTSVVSARYFLDGKPVSGTVSEKFEKVNPAPSQKIPGALPGLLYAVYDGDWNELPDFSKLPAAETGVAQTIDLMKRKNTEHFGYVFDGYIDVPETGVYTFFIDSDDGSMLYLDKKLLIDNGGLHSLLEKENTAALEAGMHQIRVQFFEKTGGDGLKVSIKSENLPKQEMFSEMLYHQSK